MIAHLLFEEYAHKIDNDLIVYNKEVAKLKSDKQVEIIKLRYLKGYKWERVASVMDLSINTVYRLHKKALERLEK